MNSTQEIVAYLYKGDWYPAKEVQMKRHADRGAFVDALPYTLSALRRRREYGHNVPEWVNLDEGNE